MRHDSLGLCFIFLFHSSFCNTLTYHTHAHKYWESSIWFVISMFLYSTWQFSNVCHISRYNLIIIDKKYTLSYVYWDHTNTSQGYINIRFFSLCYFFFWVFSTTGTTRRDFLRSYEIPRFLSPVFFSTQRWHRGESLSIFLFNFVICN